MGSSEMTAADTCVATYEQELTTGHCRCFRSDSGAMIIQASLKRAMALQMPVTTTINHNTGASGGLAILLRGGAFRGVAEDTAASRRQAQNMCSKSLVTNVVHPLRRWGVRVRIFLTVYDNVNSTMLDLLSAPYSAHVATVTRLSSRTSEQLTATANALQAFLAHCQVRSESFDAVILTRFDLYFKADAAALLGDPRTFSGIRFLWRELELGTRWRLIWSPGRDAVSASERDAWERLSNQMARTRGQTMHPSRWRRSVRTPDVFHAFSFAFARCFYMAVLVEMTRGWAPRVAPSAGNRTRTRETAEQPATNADHYEVTNHGLHKMLYHLSRAAPARTGYLLANSTYDSNPCSTTCMQNPVYEILPRGSWLVQSGICQVPSDFVWDPTSQTHCCPSPDYCCPNSVVDCADPHAILFDALATRGGQGVPRDVIRTEWRRHFLSRMTRPWKKKARADALQAATKKLTERVCPATQWSDGRSGKVGCFLAMTNSSVALVADAWRNMPAWVGPWPEDDDDVHMKSHTARGRTREALDVQR